MNLLKKDKLPSLCTVINGLDLKKRKYGYYYGYGKYGKYYGYGKAIRLWLWIWRTISYQGRLKSLMADIF